MFIAAWVVCSLALCATATSTSSRTSTPGTLPLCKPPVRDQLNAIAKKHAKRFGVPVGVGIAGKVGVDGFYCTFDAIGWPDGTTTDSASVMEEEQLGKSNFDGFLMGSFTKLWTASAVMKLHEEGRLDLDAPAHTYFENAYKKHAPKSLQDAFGAGIWKVTTRDLMNMRGGISDYDELAYQVQHPLEDLGPSFSAGYFGSSIRGVAPGTCGVYSSMSYVLLGLILVQQSGADEWYSYDQNVWKDHLPDVRFGTRGPCSSHTRIKGNCKLCNDKGHDMSKMSCTSGFTCGNMIARPRDAAHFMWSLFRGKLLKQGTVEQMTNYTPLGKPGATAGTSCSSWNQGSLYGLGVQAPAYGISEQPYTDAPGHAGVTYGFMSVNAWDKKHDLAISATAANDQSAPTSIYFDAHSQFAIGKPLEDAMLV